MIVPTATNSRPNPSVLLAVATVVVKLVECSGTEPNYGTTIRKV